MTATTIPVPSTTTGVGSDVPPEAARWVNQPGEPSEIEARHDIVALRLSADPPRAEADGTIKPVNGGAAEDTTAANVDKAWHGHGAMRGMELVVQRVKRLARELSDGAEFTEPAVSAVPGDEGDEPAFFVVLRIFLPADEDDFAFRDALFSAVAEELDAEDSARLAVRVIRRRSRAGTRAAEG